MKLGEKIKQLRTAKLMTQSELAGGEITRNMLSRIENGAAQPSLDTLKYLAQKLGVSMGYLLSDGSDEEIYIKYNEMRDIKTLYLFGEYRICRDMCLNSGCREDDEIGLILAECTLGIATEEFSRGNLRQACEYFDLAIEACARTVYSTAHVFAISAMYFKYMRNISPTLSSSQIDENDVPIWASLGDSFCLYIGAFLSLGDDQSLPIDGIVIVTSPQDLVSMIVSKAVKMANMMHIPVLGFVENYAYLECPDCGKRINVFGESRLDAIAAEFGLPVLARLPIDPKVAECFDNGKMETINTDALADILVAVEQAERGA